MFLSLERSKKLAYVLAVCIHWIVKTDGDQSIILFQSKELKLNSFPFQNTSLPWDVRVDDLVSRLTLDEIQLQMARGGAGVYGGPAPAIPRLGIKPYNWDTECLRGDARAPGNATAFPQAIGLAASFR
ncbi:Xylan 1,4-beta-xylosidase [Bulinus truncatus]|nr:Xylan 1,4-beta-xylosidase [Bulinus truncatus]